MLESRMPLNTSNPGSAPVLDLPSLPVEILHEITTHLRDVPVPCSEYRVLCCTYLERTDALHALSATCRRLRSVFLEPYWEHLEVCASQKVSDAYIYAGFHYNRGFGFALWSLELAEDFARELLQKMTVVTRRPELAVHVRCVVYTCIYVHSVNPTDCLQNGFGRAPGTDGPRLCPITRPPPQC
jgi:hypothetical protein